jgi:GNAT superfamily N-acetyltransferase
MTYTASVPVRILTIDDLPGLMALKTAANWNQTEDDIARFLRLEPNGCFGIDADGVLAASTAVITYGNDLAWIGMVLTLPQFRGRGFARALMQHAIEYCGPRIAKLDATDMGQPLYEALGFVVECPIERWRREAGPCGEAPEVEPLSVDEALDRTAFGADRTALLRELALYESASSGGSYAFARPGANAAHFGPCVSSSPEDFETMLRWFTSRHAHEAAVIDLFPFHADAARIASELGFAPFRRLKRMVLRPVAPSLPDPRIYAAAGFEWG